MNKRTHIRLQNFDYSQNGAYFITICTKDKENLFWRVGADIIRPKQTSNSQPVEADIIRQQNECVNPIIDWHTQLSDYGLMAYNAFVNIPNHYDNVFVDKMVVMPNHIHIILMLQNICLLDGRMISAPTKTISTIIGQTKRVVSKQTGKSIWQKSFYDHIIRNKDDYLKIWEYIDTNPQKWENTTNN